jgi:hypothetical protein
MAMASAVVPPGGTVCDRYTRAAAAFPVEAPSHEQLALLLAALHDAAASLRTAAAQCRVALDATRPLAKAS